MSHTEEKDSNDKTNVDRLKYEEAKFARIMPVDLEMILSASPPLFSTAAFMDFRYTPFHGPHNNNNHNKLNTSFSDFRDNPNFGPIRPCLSEKPEDQRNGKKRVWFADDKGLALTHVRIMSEPSNCPPRWTDEFLEQVTKGIKANAVSDVRWEPMFAQPASDYIEFRSRLQKNYVSLENVIIREDEENLTGTIKVKNIAFDKEVFVRISFDRWNTSQDVPSVFVPSGLESGTSLYDTFSFSASIPPSAAKFQIVEFCVCFRCSGSEYWDNNNGDNYKLAVSKKNVPQQPVVGKQFKDALKANLESWSEFASWSHLITEGPYW